MNIFALFSGVVFVSFFAAFLEGLQEQRRQDIRDRRQHQETEQWIREHGGV
jgi:hypothetical protein